MARSAAFRRLSPPKNLTAELVGRLSKEITSGKLAPGARLLTEQQEALADAVDEVALEPV